MASTVRRLGHQAVRRINLALLGAAVLMLLTAGVSALGTARLFSGEDEVYRSNETIAHLERLLALACDTETGQRGYVITGRPEYLEPYSSALPKIAQQFERLTRLTEGDAIQQRRLSDLRSLLDRKQTELASVIAVRRTQGFTAAQAIVQDDTGMKLMDQVRAIVSGMELTAQHQLAFQRDSARRTRDLTIAIGLASAVLTLAVYLSFGYLLRNSREELQRLSANIQQMREEEKTRIARELHDDLGQHLTALKMEVAMVERELQRPEVQTAAINLGDVYTLIDQMAASVRRIAANLRPLMLDDLGLFPAIEWLVNGFSARHDVRVISRLDADGIAFNHESATAVFRMVQEALTNVARHADATEVTLDIERDDTHCIVRITDNGCGTASGARAGPHSFGLLGLRERAFLLGGDITIRTAPGQGFTLTITLPLAAVEASGVE